MTALIASGSSCCASVVEPTTSMNRMLTCLSVCIGTDGGAAAEVSAASLALAAASSDSTTASPSIDR